MTCSTDSKPRFKGVEVAITTSPSPAAATTVMLALLSVSLMISPASAIGVVNSNADFNSSSYCVYLKGSQELDCLCPDVTSEMEFGHLFKQEITSHHDNESDDEEESVASVKLSSCGSVGLSEVDLSLVPRPFYRLRVSDSSSASMTGGILGLKPGDTLDIWFRGINGSVTIEGKLR